MVVLQHVLGGRLKHHMPFWKSITHSKFILQCIAGAQIPFDNYPPLQSKPPHALHTSEDQKCFVDKEIVKLLQNGSIKKLKSPFMRGWTSNIFLVPKKTPSEYF